MPGLSIVAEVLGAGATYGMAHWTLTWAGDSSGSRADGILLVALDPTGRGAAIREWTLAEGAPQGVA